MKLIFRSHLEKSPDKYIMPNAEQIGREVNELAILKPKMTGLDVHEYPNEQVVVLNGDNLWFSYKICIDEKGERDEVDTPAESTTRAMLEFHIPDTHNAFSMLSSKKQIKIFLYSHFAKPIRHNVDVRKVY